MIAVKKHGILLGKTSFEFENEGVLNPATIREGDIVHLFYRAVAKGNRSTIGYCKLNGPLDIELRYENPVITQEHNYESQGVEDPRIVKIDYHYYLSYTAYDGVNAMGAVALSKDLVEWHKLGIIVPQITYNEFIELTSSNEQFIKKYVKYNSNAHLTNDEKENMVLWDKNLIFFPRRINGKLCFIHRIRPEIQIVVSIENFNELTTSFWKDYFQHLDEYVVLSPQYSHEASYIGGGCPPIETQYGWLLIYHGVYDDKNGHVYSACAALLDLENPQKEIARLPYPLFKPEMEWEIKGEVNNVCFPTGTALFDDNLYIYYGAADEQIATASVSLSELLKELLLNLKN
ncbi:MAG: pesticidal protein Cry7Aa [Bacteroidetes bacterium]|nr:pesticidal protein Cry7Aa [Bacteroidota bacterium]